MRADRRGGPPVRVKICGITRPEDGVLAARLGTDAVGLVFHAQSPRSVTVERARAIVAALPPFVTRVGHGASGFNTSCTMDIIGKSNRRRH